MSSTSPLRRAAVAENGQRRRPIALFECRKAAPAMSEVRRQRIAQQPMDALPGELVDTRAGACHRGARPSRSRICRRAIRDAGGSLVSSPSALSRAISGGCAAIPAPRPASSPDRCLRKRPTSKPRRSSMSAVSPLIEPPDDLRRACAVCSGTLLILQGRLQDHLQGRLQSVCKTICKTIRKTICQ